VRNDAAIVVIVVEVSLGRRLEGQEIRSISQIQRVDLMLYSQLPEE